MPLEGTQIQQGAPEEAGPDSVIRGDADQGAHDLKRRTARGALTSTIAQGATMVLRTASMVALARLVVKEDFGLVNMVTAFTGLLGIFGDLGLSMAAVQRERISEAQKSALFWVNLGVGAALCVITVVVAPAIAAFYKEPQLVWITVALASGFLFSGAGAQHRAILQRSLRFGALVGIDLAALVLGVGVAVATAAIGFGCWALVLLNVVPPVAALAGVWATTRWVPGRMQRGTGLRSMVAFGGALTANGAIAYLLTNVDKVLIGRFFGAEALGIYGRAYNLINLPTGSLSSTLGLVAFPALSRVQNDPERLRRYFVQGYSLFLSVVLPLTAGCALFAEDIVAVFLGPQWGEAAPLFRLLSPTILAFALSSPFGWLASAAGRATLLLKIAALLNAPILILSFAIGLRYGVSGVAAGFSIGTSLLTLPIILLVKRGTSVTMGDVFRAGGRPLASVFIALAVSWGMNSIVGSIEMVFLRLVVETAVLFSVYGLLMVFAMGQKAVYISLIRQMGIWPVRGKNAVPIQ